jgi:putative Ca2+/H+ antiporter (TMEM165/GDT1 family)
METFAGAVGLAFGAVFLAEFGDKTQLLVLALATRHRALPVIVGVVVGAALIQGVSVAVGTAVGAVLPEMAVAVVAGLAFLAVAAWTLRGEDEEEEEAEVVAARARGLSGIGLVLMVIGVFVVGELGDKSMLATFALAARQGALATWIGSVAGEVAANLVAVVVGRQVGARLSPRVIRIGSAALFALVGVALLLGALVGG